MPESPPNASKRLRVTASGRRREASPFSDESGNSEWCRVHMACLESSVGEEENREETNVIVTIEDEAPAKEGLSASGPGLGSAGKSASGSGSAKCPQFQKAAGDMNDDTPLLMLHLAGSAKGHAKAASKGSPSKAASAASVPGSKRKRTGGDC